MTSIEPEIDVSDVDWTKVPFWKSQRALTAGILFWGFANLYMNRVNLSIAMVCMVKSGPANHSVPDPHGVAPGTSKAKKDLQPWQEGYCDSLGLKAKSAEKGEFTWDKEMQGLILGSFFWGYLFLQIPGGMLSELYGPRRVIFFTMFPVGVFGLISPLSARISPWVFLVVRVLLGLCEGTLYSATHALWSRWSPPAERSTLVGISFSGW
ncbi:hypothetical protein EGW08_013182, partial [Elysia chlorotica]